MEAQLRRSPPQFAILDENGNRGKHTQETFKREAEVARAIKWAIDIQKAMLKIESWERGSVHGSVPANGQLAVSWRELDSNRHPRVCWRRMRAAAEDLVEDLDDTGAPSRAFTLEDGHGWRVRLREHEVPCAESRKCLRDASALGGQGWVECLTEVPHEEDRDVEWVVHALWGYVPNADWYDPAQHSRIGLPADLEGKRDEVRLLEQAVETCDKLHGWLEEETSAANFISAYEEPVNAAPLPAPLPACAPAAARSTRPSAAHGAPSRDATLSSCPAPLASSRAALHRPRAHQQHHPSPRRYETVRACARAGNASTCLRRATPSRRSARAYASTRRFKPRARSSAGCTSSTGTGTGTGTPSDRRSERRARRSRCRLMHLSRAMGAGLRASRPTPAQAWAPPPAAVWPAPSVRALRDVALAGRVARVAQPRAAGS